MKPKCLLTVEEAGYFTKQFMIVLTCLIGWIHKFPTFSCIYWTFPHFWDYIFNEPWQWNINSTKRRQNAKLFPVPSTNESMRKSVIDITQNFSIVIFWRLTRAVELFCSVLSVVCKQHSSNSDGTNSESPTEPDIESCRRKTRCWVYRCHSCDHTFIVL